MWRRAARTAAVAAAMWASGGAGPTTAFEGPTWGDNLHIPIDDPRERFACPFASPPAVAVVGQTVWDLRSNQPRPTPVDGGPGPNARWAVSNDGTLIAGETGDAFKSADDDVVAWSLTSGQPTYTVPALSKTRRPLFLAFTGPSAKEPTRWLLVDGPNDHGTDPFERRNRDRVDVWDLARGSVHHSFPVAGSRTTAVSLTADGRYLAVAATDHVHVYDVRAGREVAVMRDPPAEPGSQPAPASPGPPPARPGSARRRQAAGPSGRRLFTGYPFSNGVSFSPDGRQLAGLFGGARARLILWDSGGRVSFDSGSRPMPSRLEPDDTHRNLLWSPDGTRLLLAGRWLLDVKSGAMLWRAANRVGIDRLPVFLDDGHLLAWQGDASALEPVAIPMADIRASLAAMSERRAAAVLRPGQAVSVSVELTGPSRGDPGQTTADLTRSMADALTAAGLAVTDGQATVFHLRFSESAGSPARVAQNRSPFDQRGQDQGQMLPTAEGRLTVEVRGDHGAGPAVWSQDVVGRSPPWLDGPIDEAHLRSEMLKGLCGTLMDVVWPSFISADQNLRPLPIADGQDE